MGKATDAIVLKNFQRIIPHLSRFNPPMPPNIVLSFLKTLKILLSKFTRVK